MQVEIPSARPDAPATSLQTIGENSLAHHLDLHDRLADRRRESPVYRGLLEDCLGYSLEHAVISTSEHAAPFNFSSSISYAMPQWAIQLAGLRPQKRVVIMVGTLVPFDNRHWPRGFVTDDGRRFNVFSQKVVKSCPMLQPPVDVEARPDLRKESKAFLARYPFLRPYLTSAMTFPDAAHQMSRIMEAIAAKWFPSAPCPVTIVPLEELACRMLIRLLEARDPWLERLLFDAPARAAMTASLMGTFCAWGKEHGSFLFWNRRGDRLGRFMEEDGSLVDGDARVPITRDALLDGLRSRTLLPGVFLALMVSSYLPGLAVAGGPRQPAYYLKMIRAANAVGGLFRGEELSTYGYWTVDMCRCTPYAGADRIPGDGAGLLLTHGKTDPKWLCDQLAQCPVLPIPPASDYD